jgi:hypothetical protein
MRVLRRTALRTSWMSSPTTSYPRAANRGRDTSEALTVAR